MQKIKPDAPFAERMRYVIKRNPIISGIIVFACAGLLFYLIGPSFRSRTHTHSKGGFAMSVEAHKVSVQPLAEKAVTVGSVKANESVIIRSEVPGRVKEILFQEGTPVVKGDVLVLLHDEVHKAELDEAQANLALSEVSHQRGEKLLKGNFKSAQEVDKRLSEFKRDQALFDRSKALLDKTRIVAPFDGIIGLRMVSPGDYITVGADLVNLESIDPVKIDFKLPEHYVLKVKTGQEIIVRSDALGGKEMKGKIYAINPAVDVDGRSLALRAEVQNKNRELFPGMFVVVTVILGHHQQAIMIPEEALVPKGKDQYVFRVVNNQAKLTKVKVGLRVPGKAQILEGLSPQDMVVTAGQLKLHDGIPVKVLETKG
jgi:membrane fusion protein (multidrug efflux system)